MKRAMGTGVEFKIHGFGICMVLQDVAREGRNPMTEEKVIVAGRRVTTFKPSWQVNTIFVHIYACYCIN